MNDSRLRPKEFIASCACHVLEAACSFPVDQQTEEGLKQPCYPGQGRMGRSDLKSSWKEKSSRMSIANTTQEGVFFINLLIHSFSDC